MSRLAWEVYEANSGTELLGSLNTWRNWSGPDQHAAVSWHGQHFLVQRVRAPEWQTPQPHAEIFAPGALDRDNPRWGSSDLGGAPGEVFRPDEMVTLSGFHELTGERFAPAHRETSFIPRRIITQNVVQFIL